MTKTEGVEREVEDKYCQQVNLLRRYLICSENSLEIRLVNLKRSSTLTSNSKKRLFKSKISRINNDLASSSITTTLYPTIQILILLFPQMIKVNSNSLLLYQTYLASIILRRIEKINLLM
jgi:hypothetical protein